MSPSSLRMFCASLLVGIALTPVAVAQSLNAPHNRTGSLHVLDPSAITTFKGWVDKGSQLGNAFKVIYNIAGAQEQNQGSFFYEDFGPGIPVEIFCSKCGTDTISGQPVDLKLGTAMGQYGPHSMNVWFPIAVQTYTPGFEFQLQRRDPTISWLWNVDSDVVTPILLDENGLRTTREMSMDAQGTCVNIYSSVNCNIWWGPDLQGSDPPVDPWKMQFSQTDVGPAWGPPIENSEVLCSN